MRPARRWRGAGALAVTALALAMRLGPAAHGVSDGGEPPAGLLLTPFAAPVPLPPLALTGLDGHQWPATQFQGRTVLLNFWATWCGPCRAEMPALNALYRAYGIATSWPSP